MLHWLALLIGSLAFGACVVVAMVLPRHSATLAVLMGIGGFVGALYMLGTISQVYATPLAIGSAIFIIVAGISLGYTIAASSIPHLADVRHRSRVPGPSRAPHTAIVLLESAEPELYDPVAIAYRQRLLAETADIELPLTAVPFLFLSEKTRYRAIGGRAPGASTARTLAEKIAATWTTGEHPAVEVASDQYPADLRAVVEAHVAAGTRHVAIVPLGQSESAATDHALALLDADATQRLRAHVAIAAPIWCDDGLVARLTERVLACVAGTPIAHVGVALICPGAPEAWERRYTDASETENYFVQRVRMRLADSGLKCEHVRAAWLDWQTPDVTETIRHLAVLGCQRIICVPATTVLPTLDTLLDLERAVNYARVPESVAVVTLGAWGDDDAVAQAVCSTAASALGHASDHGSDAF